ELVRLRHAELGIEPTKLAGELRRVPDAAVSRGRDVVWSLPTRDRIFLQDEVDRRSGRARACIRPHHHISVDRPATRKGERDKETGYRGLHDSRDTPRRRSEFDTTVTDDSAI